MFKKYAEMDYQSERTDAQLLAIGRATSGRRWVVVSYGDHPCTYVSLRDTEWEFATDGDYDEVPIDCHGGATYLSACPYQGLSKDGQYVGWDYQHLGDYCPWTDHFTDHQWRTEELIEEAIIAVHEFESHLDENGKYRYADY